MSKNYNLSTLNDKEFEMLCADLIASEFSTRVERFKPGRDGGIDGRFFINDKKCIIQCKHWEKSGVAALVKHAKETESPKVNNLKPDRYIFITSLELSAKNKTDLKNVFQPWIKIDNDVFGREDIEDLLDRHDAVLKRTYKLWMTSTSVLETIFNAAIIGRSESHFQEIISRLDVYAKTSFHDAALEKLKERHSIIITGEAGIGKTTLADQISLHFVADGAEFICIEDSINEAESAWVNGSKQVFYFDDFLGRNYLEAINGHEDSHIVKFIKRVSRDNSKRFILTSRTTILNQGKCLSDFFHIENLHKNEFEIRIQSTSRLERANILYNHIWHSDLEPQFIDEVYKDHRYLKIVKHRNYNPRLISFITDPNKIDHIAPHEYWNFIDDSLNRPKMIWANVFESQIDEIGRWILAAIVVNGGALEEEELRRTYLRYLKDNRKENDQQSILEFNRSLRVAVGSTLTRSLNTYTNKAAIDLFNPSIGDYVLDLFRERQQYTLPFFKWLQTRASTGNFKSFIQEGIIHKSESQSLLDELLNHAINNKSSQYIVSLLNSALDLKLIRGRSPQIIKRFLDERSHLLFTSCTNSEYISLIHSCLRNQIIPGDSNIVDTLISQILEADTYDIACLEGIAQILQIAAPAITSKYINIAKKQFLYTWKDQAGGYLGDTDILNDYQNTDELETARDELNEHFDSYASDYFDDFDDSDIEEVFSSIDLEQEFIDYWTSYARDYSNDNIGRPTSTIDQGDTAIHDLFDRN